MLVRLPIDTTQKNLLLASGWAILTALVTREAGPGPGALVLLAAVWRSCRAGAAGPRVWALPALLAAMATAPGHDAVCWPRAGPVLLRGIVADPVLVDPGAGRVTFDLAIGGQSVRCRVTAPAGWYVLPGDGIEGPARLPEQPERRRQGDRPVLDATAAALVVTPGGPGLARAATACRLLLQNGLLAQVEGESGRMLCHLVLGRGPRLAAATLDGHRDTGLSHLLAVSGAHLTMLGGMLALAFHAATRRPPLQERWFRRGCGAVLLFYGLLTGMEPPVFRAVTATFLVLVGTSAGRPVPVAALLALPALATAVIAPGELTSISFHLSYAAVLGLALSGAFPTPATRLPGNPAQWLRAALLASAWATLTTTPLTLYYFGRTAPWTILATPLLGPLVAGLLGLGLLTGITATIAPMLAGVLAVPLGLGALVYREAVGQIATWPLAPVHAGDLPAPATLLAGGAAGAMAGILWCLRRQGIGGVIRRAEARRIVGLACLGLSLPHFLGSRTEAPAGLELLAVGHGHAAILRLDDGTRALVDCGSLGAPFRASREVVDALGHQRSLDWLIVTHGDADHVGGIPDLLRRVRVHAALLPLEMRADPIVAQFRAHGTRLSFLAAGRAHRPHPALLAHRPHLAATNRNDDSLWVHVRLPGLQVVLSGDALAAGIDAWLASDRAATADVLVLPHHGRGQDGVVELLERVRPGLALVSCATADGFSAQGRIARRLGIPALHTGRVGTIRVDAGPPGTITTARPIPLR